MADPEVVALDRTGRGGEQLCTTRDLLEVEQRIFRDGEVMRTARPTGPAGASVAPEIVEAVITERPAMADEQKDMVRRLTTSGDGLQVVIGKAGAGKTYALDAARAAFQRAGYVVCGTALSARAAAELESGAGIASCTLRRFMELDNLLELSPRSVIVVDEAGMVGTRDLQQLVFHAMRKRASVVLVGDHRQLPEIEAGGVLGAVAARFDAITLTENRRQHEGWEREALDELRHGEVARAVLAYSEQGRIHLLDSAPAARVAMVADWAASRQQEPSSRMYAMARADVGELNRLARSELRARGELGDDVLEAAGRGYATGDEVLFCRNDRRLGVLNGTRGTVTGASDDHLVVETDRGHILVDPDYLAEGHLDHGYASTVHKAQGATVARAFVLGGEAMYREAGYVAMSRARERTDLYAVASAFDEGLAPNAEAELARTLSVSRAKELAISSLDPRRAAELEAERQVLAPLAAEQPRGLERAKREVGYAEHRASEHPSGSYDHEVERAEARLAKLEEAKRSFECAHGRELDRLALIEASERIGEHLLGEAVIQAPALGVDVDRERAKVPPLARSAFTRAIGAAQAKVRRVLGWERSDSAEIGHVERQEPVIDTTRRLDPDWDHRLGNDRSRGLSR
jgi:Ti-type conjugative transfer relaxase TraA